MFRKKTQTIRKKHKLWNFRNKLSYRCQFDANCLEDQLLIRNISEISVCQKISVQRELSMKTSRLSILFGITTNERSTVIVCS